MSFTWGWKAIDFVSDGSPSTDTVWAAASGQVQYVCTTSSNHDNNMFVYVRAPDGRDAIYLHLDPSDHVDFQENGTQIQENHKIGKLKHGPLTGRCGYSYGQFDDVYHLHFAFPVPSSQMVQFEDWTLNLANCQWVQYGQRNQHVYHQCLNATWSNGNQSFNSTGRELQAGGSVPPPDPPI